MRWIWIDKIIAFKSSESAVAIKNVSMAEEHLHDHFPGFPVMPEALMIEGMAQISGILVGEARDFKEKVVLAKVRNAVFFDFVRAGDSLELHTKMESIQPEAACTCGYITRKSQKIAEIDLMFSHVDQNMSGLKFPAENFVFEGNTFKSLLQNFLAEPQADNNKSEHHA